MKTSHYLAIMATLLSVNIRAAEQKKAVPGITAKPVSYFYTGKPYDKDLGSYVFAYRSYDPCLNRWTSADPSGFPDGANNRVYSPRPTFQIDAFGLNTVTLTGTLKTGNVLNIGGGIGSVTVSDYSTYNSQSQAGAHLSLSTSITNNNGDIYRWRQHFSITDQAGNFLNWNGQPANNLIDPTPPDDNKDWYWTDAERPTYATANGGENFLDGPKLNWSRIAGNVTTVNNLLTLELVQLPSINQASGGTVVLTINWGFTME